MKTSEMIRLAVKRHLHDGRLNGTVNYLETHSKFICCAIEWSGLGTQSQRVLVTRLIQKRLGQDVNTIEHWLMRNCSEFNHFRFTVADDVYNRQLQAYRARWIESIAAEYEAQGD